MTEQELLAKLAGVEALFAGTTFAGERQAAATARDKLLAKLAEVQASDPPVEQQFSLGDTWTVRLMIALLRRYGLEPYRRRGQRRTTVMARMPRKFLDETLWPQFVELSAVLREYLQQVTDRVIQQAIHPDVADAAEAPKPLGPGGA